MPGAADLEDAEAIAATIGTVQPFGDRVQVASAMAQTPLTPASSERSPAHVDRPRSCRDDARNKVVNPLGTFYEWLDSNGAHIVAVVDADPIVIDVTAASEACIAELGYGVKDAVNLGTLFC